MDRLAPAKCIEQKKKNKQQKKENRSISDSRKCNTRNELTNNILEKITANVGLPSLLIRL